jgi:hypothetical protein
MKNIFFPSDYCSNKKNNGHKGQMVAKPWAVSLHLPAMPSIR